MRILVVDDADAVRARLAAMLAEVVGVDHVYQASDAAEARAIVAGAALRVVVLDLHLRSGTSMDLVPHLKCAPSPPLVIIVTNDPTERHRTSCLALGADHFFDKARDLDRVLNAVTLAVAPAP